MSKSPDAFRTISEVADWLDTPAHVLRFWESKFAQVKPIKRAGGRRYYRPADMLLLGGIKKLLHDDGMTIKGVQKILSDQGVGSVSDLSQPLETDEEALDGTALPALPSDPEGTPPARVSKPGETEESADDPASIEVAEETSGQGTVLPFEKPAPRRARRRAAPTTEETPAAETEEAAAVTDDGTADRQDTQQPDLFTGDVADSFPPAFLQRPLEEGADDAVTDAPDVPEDPETAGADTPVHAETPPPELAAEAREVADAPDQAEDAPDSGEAVDVLPEDEGEAESVPEGDAAPEPTPDEDEAAALVTDSEDDPAPEAADPVETPAPEVTISAPPTPVRRGPGPLTHLGRLARLTPAQAAAIGAQMEALDALAGRGR